MQYAEKEKGGYEMSFVAAKCTQCGANITVDESKEAGICEYCGTAFVTEKAINNYKVSIINRNSFDGATINVINAEYKIENLIELAEIAIKGKNIDEAKKYLDEILKIDVCNLKAWKLKYEITWSEPEKYSYFLNVIKYTEDEQEREKTKNEYFTNKLTSVLNENFNFCAIKNINNELILQDTMLQDLVIKLFKDAKKKQEEKWYKQCSEGKTYEVLQEVNKFNNNAAKPCIDLLPENRKQEISMVSVTVYERQQKKQEIELLIYFAGFFVAFLGPYMVMAIVSSARENTHTNMSTGSAVLLVLFLIISYIFCYIGFIRLYEKIRDIF